VLKILGDQSKIIQDFIKNSDTVVAQLDQKKNEVARWITETGRTAAISAPVRDSIAAGFHKLPTFLDELKPTMQKLGALTDQQTPLLADLQRAAPSLTEFFTRLGPFSDASRPAFRSLAAAGDAGRRAFIDSKQEIAALNSLAKDAPKLGKPLRQLLQTADDRHRAVDGDTRAATTAPPAPDRNSNSPTPRRGFTAMESLLNYFFWQTLALNEFDDISHMLRVAGYVIPDCSNVQNDLRGPSMGGTAQQEAIRHKCASYQGPYQPGVTAPDPTQTLKASKSQKVSKATKATKPGERRGAGQPRALPLPGQFDPSIPHVSLPPAIQSLLDRLRNGTLPHGVNRGSLPSLPRGAAPDQMLDFLLSP
jgi:hypothetical protein